MTIEEKDHRSGLLIPLNEVINLIEMKVTVSYYFWSSVVDQNLQLSIIFQDWIVREAIYYSNIESPIP